MEPQLQRLRSWRSLLHCRMFCLFLLIIVCRRLCANAEGVNVICLVDCDVDCAVSETAYFNVQEDAEDLEGTYGYWEA